MSYNQVWVVIPARLESTRLPRKIFLDLCGDPIIRHVTDRLKKSKKIEKIIIATTFEEEDVEICQWCNEESLEYFRGETENVLSRYYHCANTYKATNIVRVTSDCPLIDPKIIDKTIGLFTKENLDYASNNLKKTFPHGMDVEVFTFKALEVAYFNATKTIEREHVTQFIRQRPEEFKINNFSSDKNLSDIRVTIDEKEDLILIKKIVETLGKEVDCESIADLFLEFPELKKINENAKKSHNIYNKERKII